MPRQSHQARFSHSIAEVFSALLRSLATRRWAEGRRLEAPSQAPAVGCRYVNRRDRVIRRGRVLECRRPVSLTLYESLIDPPCRVRLKLRWRLEPVEPDSLLRLDVGYDLNGAASLRKRHWHRQIHAHCRRMLREVGRYLSEARAQGGGSIGQSHGSNNIAAANITKVSGSPSFK